MRDTFCRISRCVVEHNGRLRLTETRTMGYYTDNGVERPTACCGKSIPYKKAQQENTPHKAA